MPFFSDIGTSFVLGLLTPLGAVCVLPLLPGFIAYLTSQVSEATDKKKLIFMGIMVTLGVIVFMALIGILFTTILQISLTKVIGIVSPIAFTILLVISILLIFNVEIGKIIPQFKTPTTKKSMGGSFVFGFFFGAVVLPCNPLLLAALFARTLDSLNYVSNIISFVFFGIGMAAPLLLFAIISSAKSTQIINFLLKYKKQINLITGIIMLVISLYYIILVFNLYGLLA